MASADVGSRLLPLAQPSPHSGHGLKQFCRNNDISAVSNSSCSYHISNPDLVLAKDTSAGSKDRPSPSSERIEDECALDHTSTRAVEDIVLPKPLSENADYGSHTSTRANPDGGQLILHKHALRRQEMQHGEGDRPSCIPIAEGSFSPTLDKPTHNRRSSSDSSFAFVTATKSASMSLGNVSMLTRSRRDIYRLSRVRSRTDRSSRASVSGPRISLDSSCLEPQPAIDPATRERSLQRRRILEELISTEENYIGDVRFLMNVYVTILASLPANPPGLRLSVNQNLNDIVQLHEEILGELHHAVPYSEYTQPGVPLQNAESSASARELHRWRSPGVLAEAKNGTSRMEEVTGMLAEPHTAAEVARIFSKKMHRFFIYEEYGAKYKLMIKDVASAHRTMPGWLSYQKGLELLAASLVPDGQGDHSRKSLTIGDLLVKPIQRVCKYPLLFWELLKHTPVVDCPCSYLEIENTLIRLREATAEINRATDDSRAKSALERTWILQDRLVFPNQLDAASRNRIRSFGHAQLCGALHACWQTKEGVSGQYMIALLYREWFCLATAGKADHVYAIQACIFLANAKLEEVDNGRGLQCHTAQHSWKLVFVCGQQLYELILTACTDKEELEWRTRLEDNQKAAVTNCQDQAQPEVLESLSLNIRALGTVFRKQGTAARKISMHRTITVGAKSPLCQVILKNTTVREAAVSGNGSHINRSQSLYTTNSRIPVLAPSRAERARLEALLADVWTRDVLPFPGMTVRSRSEQLVRASASSVMRRLSSVSITGRFAKRSSSFPSLLQLKGAGSSPVSGEETSRRSKEEPRPETPASHQLGEVRMSPLSMIPDETERSSPSLAPSAASPGSDPCAIPIGLRDILG
ncbi:Dbl homology domain-containing protein [Canariomyces notabilis]|uniref:Dbl homology domain-containing protein n=1 Tax=Canariomyces notabilis TaxID=2074819 RepID=A0AAN6YWS8_9PEZI|nr:Dbl homology domain-containing protein [Canariomyces arenarius]